MTAVQSLETIEPSIKVGSIVNDFSITVGTKFDYMNERLCHQ